MWKKGLKINYDVGEIFGKVQNFTRTYSFDNPFYFVLNVFFRMQGLFKEKC